jgi:hypothetical protein
MALVYNSLNLNQQETDKVNNMMSFESLKSEILGQLVPGFMKTLFECSDLKSLKAPTTQFIRQLSKKVLQ